MITTKNINNDSNIPVAMGRMIRNSIFFSPFNVCLFKDMGKGSSIFSLFFFLSSYSISQNEFSFLLGNINVMYSKCDCPLICRQLIFVKRIRCLPSVAIEIPIFTPKLIAFIAKSAGIRKRGGEDEMERAPIGREGAGGGEKKRRGSILTPHLFPYNSTTASKLTSDRLSKFTVYAI